MKFNIKFGNINKKNLTSEQVRKTMSQKTDLTVKKVKEAISHAIKSFFADHRTFEVEGQPHVEVVRNSVPKKVMEMHRNMVAEKERQHKESEERAREQELKDAAVAKKERKQARITEGA